jgi:hypothetical protein
MTFNLMVQNVQKKIIIIVHNNIPKRCIHIYRTICIGQRNKDDGKMVKKKKFLLQTYS